ncbi:MAG: glycosyltransferase family 4 protein [Candidatus Acidiferrales bacterium]
MLLSFPRRWLCRKVACNITITDHVASRILLPRSRTIYYGISEWRGTQQEENSVSSPLHFAYVGRLVAEKGLSVLIGAARLLRDQGCLFRLTFVGDGHERNRLEHMVDSLGLRSVTVFAGGLRGEALEAILQEVEVVVMPSIWEETAGLSAIEHMMRGRAVIVSDIGGLSEVVGDAGLKFSCGDAEGLARSMRLMIEHPWARSELGRSGRERALKLFRSQGMIDAHAILYEEIIRR